MQLQHLRYFCEVAKQLNITQAAKTLNIPQPALSSTISKLEKEIGASLFDRYNNRITLTDEGKMFFQNVQLSLQYLDSGIQAVRENPQDLHGELRLLVLRDRLVLFNCIHDFSEANPNVKIVLTCHRAVSPLESYDLCISEVPPSPDYDSSAFLGEEEMQVMVSKEHPLAQKDKITIYELDNESIIISSRESESYRHLAQAMAEAGLTLKERLICDDIQCFHLFVSSGTGVCLASPPYSNVMSEQVSYIPLTQPFSRKIYLYWNGKRSQSSAVRAFCKYLKKYFPDFSGHIFPGSQY